MRNIVPKLKESQLDRLSEFLANLSLVFFASMVIPLLISLEKFNIMTVVSGSVLTSITLIISLIILE
jgi:hypothetical protein